MAPAKAVQSDDPLTFLPVLVLSDKKTAERTSAEVGERLPRSFQRIKLERQPGADRLDASTSKAPVYG